MAICESEVPVRFPGAAYRHQKELIFEGRRADMDERNKLKTTRETAEILRCSEVTLWRLRREGHLAFVRVLGKILFRQADIEHFIESRRRGGSNQSR